MKSQIGLLVALMEDSTRACGANHLHDINTLCSRVEHEGLSFLTITLPNLCQAFERGLETGQWDSSLASGFARIRSGSLPKFLSGLSLKVFDSDGRIRLDACPNAVLYFRQLTLTYKKVKHECSKERTAKAFAQYVSTDEETSHTHSVGNLERNQFLAVCDVLAPRVFGRVDRDCYNHDTVPRHGPGATAEKVSGNAKYSLKQWHSRLERSFPLDLFASPNLGACGGLESIELISPEMEIPVRVISVPKTQKTPRIIAIEPSCVQYTQQALMSKMADALEGFKLLPKRVNFTDQTVNQRMAKEGSRTKKFATLDLSEASDRVSCQLVGLAFRKVRNLRRALFDSRSRRACLPDGTIRTLSKFASMGSATCFPVESFVFYAIAIAGQLEAAGLSPTLKNILKVGRETYVYGDDIIVASKQAPYVTGHLEALGLKVNKHKSFVNGSFRESCGYDAFNGFRVTPIYCRTLLCDKLSASDLGSAVALSNLLYKAGNWVAACWVQQHVEQILSKESSFPRIVSLPLVAESSAGLGWYSYSSGYSVHRVCVDTHAPQVRTYVLSAPRSEDPIDGYNALMKFFLRPPCEVPDRTTSVTLSARTLTVRKKLTWTSPF